MSTPSKLYIGTLYPTSIIYYLLLTEENFISQRHIPLNLLNSDTQHEIEPWKTPRLLSCVMRQLWALSSSSRLIITTSGKQNTPHLLRSISCLLPESAPFLTPRMDERSSEHVVSRMDEQADFFLLGFDESRRSTLFLTPKEWFYPRISEYY
jgi:hypothetical protein